MKTPTRSLALTAFAFVLGCSDSLVEPVTLSESEAPFHTASPQINAVSVLNWNIYVGTDLDAVISALVSPDPEDDIPAFVEAIEVLQRTAFPVRAQAIADIIATKRPHVVGLQEVSIIDADLRALDIPVVIELDYLAVLQAALAARSLNYVVAAQVTDTDATPFPGVRLVDQDVILVDPARVSVLATAGQNFSSNIGVVAPGVEIKRGWVAATVRLNDQTVTFVNTHLESGAGEQLSALRAAQALELMTILEGTSPAILMGDLNEGQGTPMYQIVTGAGFTDLWTALRPGQQGLTCCHLADLSNTFATFDQRIDYLFTRGFGEAPRKPRGVITILGDAPGDRITGPTHSIWPSDHAGLAARLLPPRGDDPVVQ